MSLAQTRLVRPRGPAGPTPPKRRTFVTLLSALTCALACLGLALSLPQVAQAQGKPRRPSSAEADRVARAEAAFKRAGAAFDAGKLEMALANYQESYALWPRPRTLLNLGVVLRKLGRVAEAANLLSEYIEHEAADAERVDAVKRTLAEIDAEVGRLQITALGSGPVELDGKPLELERLARPVRVEVGRHRLSQDADTVEIAISRGQDLPIEIGRARPAVEKPPAPPPVVTVAPPVVVKQPTSRERPRRWYLWSGVATVLAAGGTGYLAVRLSSQQSELDDILANPSMHDYAEAVDARDRADRTALYTNVGLGVTAAGVVLTGVLFFLYDDGQRSAGDSSTATLVPSLGASGDGVGLSLSGSF